MAAVKSKLNPERRILIIEGMRVGLTKELCAMRAGIGISTLLGWLADGRKHRDAGYRSHTFDADTKRYDPHAKGKVSKCLELLESLERAESQRLTEALLGIREAAKGGKQVVESRTVETLPDGTQRVTERMRPMPPDWHAHKWLAEKTRPRDYGQFVRTEVTGNDGGPVQVQSFLDLINHGAAAEEAEERAKKGVKS